jgi:transposase
MQYDYTRKNVYVGIDVHKKTYVCVSVCDGEVVKKDSMPAAPTILLQYLKNTFKGAYIFTAYEAGFCGFYLHRQLVATGVKSMVVHPGSIEVASRDRVKTDKRDAMKLAVQLSAGRLRGIYVPTVEQEATRSVSRLRDEVVKFRQKTGNKLKSLLFTQNLINLQDDNLISQKWIKNKLAEIKAIDLPTAYIYTVKYYAQQWLKFTDELKNITAALKKMQSPEEQKLLRIYESAPGIGSINALRLKDELYDMSQFSNEKKLFSYLGFTPTEYSSGEHTYQGHISRQGRSKLRHIFVEAAWIAIRKDPNLQSIFERIAKTRGSKKSIVAVAKRLAGRLRTCLREGKIYEIKLANEKKQIPADQRVVRDLEPLSVAL